MTQFLPEVFPQSDKLPEDDMSYWQSILDESEGFCKVAYIDEKIVGFVLLEKWMCCITSVYVDENYRHQGIATLFVNSCIEKAKKQGRRFISLDALAGNNDAKRLYEKLDFYEYQTTMIKDI